MTIEQALRKLGLDPKYLNNLEAFLTLFAKWNKSINLSAASSRGELLGHLTDSLHVVPHLAAHAETLRSIAPEPRDVRVLDVGSGGGFPVVVAAICAPSVQFTALEPVHKKHAFLRTAARELELSNLDPLAERLDDHEPSDYDAAMSRATLDLREWLEAGSKRVVVGGIVLGFEAVRRDDLPAAIERHAYSIDAKPRTIVLLHR